MAPGGGSCRSLNSIRRLSISPVTRKHFQKSYYNISYLKLSPRRCSKYYHRSHCRSCIGGILHMNISVHLYQPVVQCERGLLWRFGANFHDDANNFMAYGQWIRAVTPVAINRIHVARANTATFDFDINIMIPKWSRFLWLPFKVKPFLRTGWLKPSQGIGVGHC